MAIIILDGFIDVKNGAKSFENHVKPACWKRGHSRDSGQKKRWEVLSDKFGSRCFVGGWGLTEGTDFALANNLKFTSAKIVDPKICAREIQGDVYLQDDANHEKVICAEVNILIELF